MSGSWARAHRRHALVQAVLNAAAERGSGDLSGWDASLANEFGDVDRFLLDLQRRWRTAFECRLDALLEDPLVDVAAAMARLRRELSDVYPGLRLVLEHHRDSSVLVALSGLGRDPGQRAEEFALPMQWCAD